MNHTAVAILNRGADRRIRAGHPWIFSNELGAIEGSPENGKIIEVQDNRRSTVGYGFYSRQSLISIRLLSRKPIESIEKLLLERVVRAQKQRELINYGNTYRLIFGESDNLPGLVIDRYAETFVIESFISGIDVLVPTIRDLLVDLFKPECIVEKSDSIWRSYEGLETINRVLFGQNEDRRISIDAMFYNINVLLGQKTGFYLDQRENRSIVERLSKDRKVLDCFSSDGGFALHAARGGAASVVGVDSSDGAVERASMNAESNGLSGVRFVKADVFKFLQGVENSSFDVIVLDPPAFVKSKKKLAPGLKGYRKLNELAMEKLSSGGILISCSCSQHATEELFLETLGKAAASKGKRASIISITGAAKDHPVLLSMPETRYLTCVAAIVEAL